MTQMHTDEKNRPADAGPADAAMKTGERPRAMTEIEVRACRVIAPWLVRYPFDTHDRRFAGEMASAAERPIPRITDAQAVRLWAHVQRYRVDVFDPQVVAEADRQAAEQLNHGDTEGTEKTGTPTPEDYQRHRDRVAARMRVMSEPQRDVPPIPPAG